MLGNDSLHKSRERLSTEPIPVVAHLAATAGTLDLLVDARSVSRDDSGT
jgi:hypothetical protein